LAQAAVAFEELAALAVDRLSADRSQLVGSVRLLEGSVCDPQAAQSVHTLTQLSLSRNGANDQVGMRQIGWKKRGGNLDGCVAGLDGLLGNGEIIPYDEVNIGRVVLGEVHGVLLLACNL
jgi:hypothetical protein